MTAKEKAPETTITLKEDVMALASKIEAGLAIDKKTGVGTEKVDLYEANLPEGLTMETKKAFSDYETTFIAAGTYAFGKMAVDALKSNKDLKSASVEIKMGTKDVLALNVDRSKEYSNHLGTGDAKTTKYGVTTATYEVRAGKNSGQLKAARQLVGELAAAKLK